MASNDRRILNRNAAILQCMAEDIRQRAQSNRTGAGRIIRYAEAFERMAADLIVQAISPPLQPLRCEASARRTRA